MRMHVLPKSRKVSFSHANVNLNEVTIYAILFLPIPLCHSGEIIFKQGDEGRTFYIIMSGSVKVLRYEYDTLGKRLPEECVGHLRAGDSFGELALLMHSGVRNATIEVVCM
jgi:hypothetical protein